MLIVSLPHYYHLCENNFIIDQSSINHEASALVKCWQSIFFYRRITRYNGRKRHNVFLLFEGSFLYFFKLIMEDDN